MSSLLGSFNDRVYNILGFKLRKYQEHVANEVIGAIERGSRFIIVSMPTGSGKTLIEMFTAFYGLQHGIPRILVLSLPDFSATKCMGEEGNVAYGVEHSGISSVKNMRETVIAFLNLAKELLYQHHRRPSNVHLFSRKTSE